MQDETHKQVMARLLAKRPGSKRKAASKQVINRAFVGRPPKPDPVPRDVPVPGLCAMAGCDAAPRSRGCCQTHYRWLKRQEKLVDAPPVSE